MKDGSKSMSQHIKSPVKSCRAIQGDISVVDPLYLWSYDFYSLDQGHLPGEG